VSSLSATEYAINVGVLETAHSIFRPWRAHVRTDSLYTEINFVLSRFMKPFQGLFQQTGTLLLSGNTSHNLGLLTQTMILLVDIFYDFTCHDLPPDLEDGHAEFFSPETGWFHRFLAWDPPSLRSEVGLQTVLPSTFTDNTYPSLMISCPPFPRSSKRVFLKSQR
jgi:exportin-2 (importin alpha re-exporter)